MGNRKSPYQFKVYQSTSFNPYVNLSIEEYLFTRLNENILFFYRNDPCVVLGRFQVPWNECRPSFLANNSILLLRRISGGGAVYHDPGNLNFSVISDPDRYSRETYMKQVRQCIESFGITVSVKERNSLVSDGYKISGNAYRFIKNRVLYHGTLLVDSDISMLKMSLQSLFDNNTCRGGIRSVKCPVINLKSIIPDVKMDNVIMELALRLTRGNDPDISPIENKVCRKDIESLVDKHKSFEWVYGQTPANTVIMPLNEKGRKNECFISIKKGRIEQVEISGFRHLSRGISKQVKKLPFFSTKLIEQLKCIQKEGEEKNIIIALIEKIGTLKM